MMTQSQPMDNPSNAGRTSDLTDTCSGPKKQCLSRSPVANGDDDDEPRDPAGDEGHDDDHNDATHAGAATTNETCDPASDEDHKDDDDAIVTDNLTDPFRAGVDEEGADATDRRSNRRQ
jgi:hypothetical protein